MSTYHFKVYGGSSITGLHRYHIFLSDKEGRRGPFTSLCEQLTVETRETRIPGAPTCEVCERKALDLAARARDEGLDRDTPEVLELEKAVVEAASIVCQRIAEHGAASREVIAAHQGWKVAWNNWSAAFEEMQAHKEGGGGDP